MKRKAIYAIALAVLMLGLSLYAPAALASESLESVLGRVPVQHGGRVKPFASFARETLLLVTGKSSFENQDPTTVVWGWIGNPEAWSASPILPVGHLELRTYFSKELVHNRISPASVLRNTEFRKLVIDAQMKEEKEKKATHLEKKQMDLFDRARLFEEVASGRMPGFIPHPSNPKASWFALDAFMDERTVHVLTQYYPRGEVENVFSSFGILRDRLKGKNLGETVFQAKRFSRSLENLLLSRDIALDKNALQQEFLYLKFRPFQLAWILYLVSLFLWLAPRKGKKGRAAAIGLFASGFAIHTFGFVLRMLIAGRPPVANMYESIIWAAWSAALFALIFWMFYRSEFFLAVAACVAAVGLLVGESFPAVLNPAISPLAPVLRSNFWLTVHVLTITLGYGAFLLNWGIAHALLYGAAFNKKKESLDHLAQYLYRTLQAGTIFLIVGTILGGVWAAESWGRFWGWDPKETWALIAILAYLAVLHSRTAGWLDARGVAFWSALSFLTILMAWYGVNYVLGAGLHSYGFGGGGEFPYVLAFVLLDTLVLFWFVSRLKPKPRRY